MTKDRIRTADTAHMSRVRETHQGIYLKYAKQLIEQGDAYYCFCTKERLDSLKASVGEDGKEIAVYDKHCLHL